MRKKNKRIIKKSYSIIVDGDTEKWYLDLLKKHEKERLPRIDIKPDIPKNKKLKNLYEQVIEASNFYDKVIWLLDLDVILKNNKEHEFFSYFKRLSKRKNVFILVNNPCLEFWFLIHFNNTAKIYRKCSNIEKELRKTKELSKYKKTEKYYKAPKNDIYLKIKKYQDIAIERAKKLGRLNFEDINSAKAEIYLIFEILFE